MATSAKYVAGNRTDSTRSNAARAQAARPVASLDDGNNNYSDVDGNILVGAVGGGGNAAYGTYASSGRTTLTSHGDKATHMLIQQGGRQRSAYSDSDTENASDYKHRRTGPCRCCSRTCFGLWLMFVLVVIGFALAVASIVMYAFLVRDHLQQNVKQQAQQSLDAMYDRLVDNLRRAANGTAGDGVSRAQLIFATADYHAHHTTTSTTPAPTTTTTDNSLVSLAHTAVEDATSSTTTEVPTATESIPLETSTLVTTTTTKPAVPAVGALRLPALDPADHVASKQTYAGRISMADVPDPTKTS